MEDEKKKCMICGKPVVEIRNGICNPCQEQIRREALGRNADTRTQAEKELKKYGVPADRPSRASKK